MSETYISLEQQGAVATVWLERPEVHNAFNADLIRQLKDCFVALNQRDDVRVVVLAGRGKSFSAGADLNWMKAAGAASEAENQADAQNLADMLYALATLKQPTIARVQGAAMGGGMGLAATVVGMEALDAKVEEIVAALLLGGPVAQQASKQLIALVAKRDNSAELRTQTAAHIASVRAGQEAKEGLNAFLEKRAAAWCNSANPT